ncbi:MAG TPA: hypothetical protein VMU66_11365 [Gaiellales bacterium]|nr:hypothetical protein [Gaiellales bacterium]
MSEPAGPGHDPAVAGPDDRRKALESLLALPSVIGVSNEGAELRLEPRELDGEHLTVRAPRLLLAGVETLTVRFAVDSLPWRVTFELRQAEYESFDHALARLRLRSAERGQVERVSRREPVRAAGTARVLSATNVLPGNSYPIVIEERSASGLRFTCEWDVSAGDTFVVAATIEGVRYSVRAAAVNVHPAPFGRRIVGARVQ